MATNRARNEGIGRTPKQGGFPAAALRAQACGGVGAEAHGPLIGSKLQRPSRDDGCECSKDLEVVASQDGEPFDID